jgi:selenocysteine lyase/cysteine desulfurase
MSPHFFTSDADIDRAFEVLDETLDRVQRVR